jgi:hypothetical protein
MEYVEEEPSAERDVDALRLNVAFGTPLEKMNARRTLIEVYEYSNEQINQWLNENRELISAYRRTGRRPDRAHGARAN